MNLRRVVFWGVVTAALAGVLTSWCCSNGTPAIRTLRMAYTHELVSLDPHSHADVVTRTVLESIYEGLVSLRPGVPVRPMLADRWSTPNDLTWRIHIRDDVFFHDGRPLTTIDVVASIERARAKGARSYQLAEIETVSAVEGADGIVEIITTKPSPLLLARLALVAIIPCEFEPSSPIGTGPYRWRVGSVQGPILLDKWDEYWGPSPDFEEVSIQIVASDEAMAVLIDQQRLDVVASVSISYLTDHEQHQSWQLVSVPSVSTTFLGVNVLEPPLDDPRVRRALDFAIDRSAFEHTVFPPEFARAAGFLVPPEVFGFSPGKLPQLADLEQSRRILEAVGVKEGTRLRLDHSNRYLGLVDFLVESFSKIGFTVEPESHPYEVFYRRLEDATNQLFIFAWVFRPADASTFLDAVVRSRDPLNVFGRFNGAAYSHPEVDRLIKAASHEPRSSHRLGLLQEALAITSQAKVYLPLFHTSILSLVREPFTIGGRSSALPRPQDVCRRR